jgi:hypothetical protein
LPSAKRISNEAGGYCYQTKDLIFFGNCFALPALRLQQHIAIKLSLRHFVNQSAQLLQTT